MRHANADMPPACGSFATLLPGPDHRCSISGEQVFLAPIPPTVVLCPAARCRGPGLALHGRPRGVPRISVPGLKNLDKQNRATY